MSVLIIKIRKYHTAYLANTNIIRLNKRLLVISNSSDGIILYYYNL